MLVRHGRTTANATGLLAGRTPGVLLDDVGERQATATAQRLADVPIAEIVTSPLERCTRTAAVLAAGRDDAPPITIDDRLTECGYGTWQNRPLSELAKDDLWKIVQNQPSEARFPEGESLVEMQERAVAAIREHDAAHTDRTIWIAVSHGDVIKSILADALGMHLDRFQRITVHPASVSIVRYHEQRSDVIAMNTEAGDLSWLARSTAGADAPVGGGAGAPDAS